MATFAPAFSPQVARYRMKKPFLATQSYTASASSFIPSTHLSHLSFVSLDQYGSPIDPPGGCVTRKEVRPSIQRTTTIATLPLVSLAIAIIFEMTVGMFQTAEASLMNIPSVNSLQTIRERMCNCGTMPIQAIYCSSDFVIVGKVKWNSNQTVKPSHESSWFRNGTKYKVRVKMSLKGIPKRKKIVDITIVNDMNCGETDIIDQARRPQRHSKVLIMGFVENGAYFVTRCNFMSQLNDLTKVQAIGLFTKKFKQFCKMKSRCKLEPLEPTFNREPSFIYNRTCGYDPRVASCVSKYAICEPVRFMDCEFKFKFKFKSRWRSNRKPTKIKNSRKWQRLRKFLNGTRWIHQEQDFQYDSELTSFHACLTTISRPAKA